MQSSPKSYLSVAKFAQMCGLSGKTIRRRIKAGHLPHLQPGGPKTKILIPVDALDRQANSKNISAAEPAEMPKTTPRVRKSGPPAKWKQFDDRPPEEP